MWAWRKANPFYVVMRLPEKKRAPTAFSSWTSPELGLQRYLDGPKTVSWITPKDVDQSVKYDCKKTLSEQEQPDMKGDCARR